MHTILALPAKAQAKTPAQAREEFDRKGVSIAKWAKKHGVNKSLVYEVLRGNRKCHRGDSHKVAVLLGMKHGEIVND
jgi:gp16 family phage-associated protein